MAFFAAEPALPDPAPERTAVLLCNLGTPDAPEPAAVRRYLAEFLSDRRVVEIPRAAWLPLLHGVILRTRPAKSARKYASIWTSEGSPLLAWTARQAQALGQSLQDAGQPVLVLPLYPQYSCTTTASVVDAVAAWSQRVRNQPELRFVQRYGEDPGYVDALAARVHAHWRANGRGERLVLSFHGVPRRTRDLGDPYHGECMATVRRLRERLGLPEREMLVTFQSRLGRAEWLQPYTEPTLVALAKQGVARVDVMCPGFTSDCLETLEEIDQEVRAAFLGAGGREFHYIACLNDSHPWIAALAALAIRHMQGWPAQMPADGTATA